MNVVSIPGAVDQIVAVLSGTRERGAARAGGSGKPMQQPPEHLA
jgi:hypothetical protein